jgi:hypothetical protein
VPKSPVWRHSAISVIARFFAAVLIGPLALVALGLWSGPAVAEPYTSGAGPLQTSTGSTSIGSPVSLSGTGFAPDVTVSIFIASTPTLIGTTTTNSAGDFATSVVIPSGLESGTHTLSATGPAAGGGMKTLAAAITVKGGTTSAATSSGDAPSGAGQAASGGGVLAFTGADIVRAGTIGIALILLGGLIAITVRRVGAD